ncbi:MAG: hypothetical protein ACODAE_08090 [Gemmatimonadota bacterium]
MHPVLRRADRFEDLPPSGEHDSPYVFETIFDGADARARRLSRKKLKLLRRIDERLRAVLDEGERVRYVTFGSAIDNSNHLVTWLAARIMNRRAIVLTDRRMLLLQIDDRLRPKRLVNQIRYPAIHEVTAGRTGNVRLRLGEDKARQFAGVPRRDGVFLRELVESIGTTMRRAAIGLEHLCPRCHSVVQEPGASECPTCALRFASTRRATLLSLLVPGLGDIPLGYHGLALVKFAVAAVVWLGPFLSDVRGVATTAEIIAFIAGIVVVIHGAAAGSTWSLARMGVYPAGGARSASRG